MLLAGNGSSSSHNKPASMAKIEAPPTRPSTADGFIRNWSHIPASFTSIPGSISVTLRSDTLCGGGSNSTNGLALAKTGGASASSSNHSEPPKVVSTVGSASTTVIPAGTTWSILLNHLLFCCCHSCDFYVFVSNLPYEMHGRYQHDVTDFFLFRFAVAVPQARKASLARFLEKRKER